MTTALTLVSGSLSLPAALGPDLAAAVDLAKAEKAASTRKPARSLAIHCGLAS